MVDFLILLAYLALRFGPPLFFEHMVYEVGKDRPPLPLTGHEVARKLLELAGASSIQVVDAPKETPSFDDHYDSEARTVSLSPAVADARTVVAYAIAAHEIGHALQHQSGDRRFGRLMTLRKASAYSAWGLLLVLPLALLMPDNFNGALTLALALTIGFDILVRLLTVPMEWDASFGRGLPALLQAGLLPASEVALARRILFAAATTYIGFAAVGLLAILSLLWS